MAVILFLLSFFLFAESAFALQPNDPYFSQWAYMDIGIYKAWDRTTGSKGVVVAVIDNGFDTFHPDLHDNVWKNNDEIADNGFDDDQNGYIDDVWGWNFVDNNNDPRPSVENLGPLDLEKEIFSHGTFVAGIIGAVGNNGFDGVGINWQVKLMNLKVLDNSGTGEVLPLGKAITYAVNNGAHVINISLVGNEDKEAIDAVKYAFERGVAVIAAVGNDFLSLDDYPRYPVCADSGQSEEWLLGVSAIAESHRLAIFSNAGACVDITAPGVNVSSTLRYSPTHELSPSYGGGWNGTSFAAPLVSGTAALLKSIRPDWKARDIYRALLASVHHTPGQNEAVYARLFGAGLLQADKAIEFALSDIAKARVLNGFFVFDVKNGISYEFSTNKASPIVAANEKIKDIKQAVGFFSVGQKKFLTLKENKNQAEIMVFDSNWNKEQGWSAITSGDASVLVGNVIGDQEKEIIVYSSRPDKKLFSVYAMDGKLLLEKTNDKKHNGVSLGLVRIKNDAKERQEVVAYYAENGGKPALKHFALDFSLKRNIVLSGASKKITITVADVDGDNIDEYIISGGSGASPLIEVVGRDGAIKRSFLASDAKMVSGLEMAAGDYDGDGIEDVLVLNRGGGAIRVWNGRVKKLDEWWLPEKNGIFTLSNF